MKRLSVAVAVFGIATLCSVAQAQFTPQWHVGDWWIVKQWCTDLRGGMDWRPWRYDVLGIEKVGGKDCFVLQAKLGDTTPARDVGQDLFYVLFYVRKDNWRIVREAEYYRQAGKLRGPGTRNYPTGMFGPRPDQSCLPLFPLDTASVQDSTFRLYGRIHGSVGYLRHFSGLADSGLLNRYRSDPDTSGGRPVQPGGGTMFAALSEGGTPRDGSIVPSSYDLQLWSSDYPWHLYSEGGQYLREGVRSQEKRSWLIRCGRSGR